jgi:hypothetical protein
MSQIDDEQQIEIRRRQLRRRPLQGGCPPAAAER